MDYDTIKLMRWFSLKIFVSSLFFLIPPIVYAAPATLDDYWKGMANWKYYHKLDRVSYPFTKGWNDTESLHVQVVNGVWYLFHRKATPTPGCLNDYKLQVVLHTSADKGMTWGPEIPILGGPSRAPDECMATDGSVYYNASENKWYFLYQCFNGDWAGCLATRDGADPNGPFQSVPDNPVITSGELTQNICNDPSDDCKSIPTERSSPIPTQEGTFNIMDFDGQFYFVSFHAYDGKRGYRGIAKTRDFRTYITDPSQGVPSDVVLDLKDQLSWRETWQGEPIGFGHAGGIKEGSKYYMVSEGADRDLACTLGQNWDIGIFRTNNLSLTNWEQYPLGNPIIYSSKSVWAQYNGPNKTPTDEMQCGPAYTGLFRDSDGSTFLYTTQRSPNEKYYGIYFWKLTADTNILKNADFWMCNESNWQRIHGSSQNTNYVTYRFMENSSDGNCYLATNCGGATCQPNQSVYQDVTVNGKGITNVRFGGKIMSEGAGSANIALFELDSNGNPLANHTIPVAATTSYQSFTSTATLANATHTLRFQVYLNSPQTFRLDELFVEPIPAEPTATPTTTPSNTPSPIPGDLNNDRKVDIQDVLAVLNQAPLSLFRYALVVGNYGR